MLRRQPEIVGIAVLQFDSDVLVRTQVAGHLRLVDDEGIEVNRVVKS